MHRLRKLVVRLVMTVAVLLLAALVGIGWLGSERLVAPPRRDLQDYHRRILSAPAQYGLEITPFTANRRTPCLLVQAAPAPGRAAKSHALRAALRREGVDPGHWGEVKGTVVLLHGHTGRKEDHLPITERFVAAGFRCLVPDLPGHGEHPSDLATFGKTEASLVNEVLSDAEAQFGFAASPAFLFGISQGGAIALQAAAGNPDRWTAIATAAAFASLDRPIRQSASSFHPSLKPYAAANSFAVACGAWTRARLWPAAIRPAAAARRFDGPLMVIHGENDRLIPIRQGREIFEASPSPRKRFRSVANAGHGRVMAEDAESLYPEICRFFLEALSHETGESRR